MKELNKQHIQFLETLDKHDARQGGNFGVAFDPGDLSQLEELESLGLVECAGSFPKAKTYWRLTELGEQVLEVQREVTKGLLDELGGILDGF